MITASLANTLICDLLITGSLLYYLNRNRTGFKSLDSIIKRLMWYSLSTGLLTSIFALASMVTFITMSHNLINVGISFFLGRLYANSLMTTLNGRAETRAKFSNNHEPIQLSDIPQETSILTPNSLLDGQHPQDLA
ncbi:hypothetical protein BD410DRAFT_598387 [Rickenella mellea]|uniref:DUF6534 domain-containing protein n=1 Tax=Rickenella mellea TaxID=50990 RepID=A0A4Y7QEQ8_9AGAM|nr:hypothetical protein BD410DRAFT_598387 [Rickenella mellea]